MRGADGLDVGDRVTVQAPAHRHRSRLHRLRRGEVSAHGRLQADSPLAYKNEAFLDSDDARPLRILAEYLQPLYAFQREQICGTVVFFGSARLRADGPLGRYYDDARELARLVTLWSKDLSADVCHCVVCTGGGGGIMEAANRGAADAGGKSIGLNIGLPHEQRPNAFISPGLSFEFHYFFMRKLWFAHLARALVVFPGGFGTLDELDRDPHAACRRRRSSGAFQSCSTEARTGTRSSTSRRSRVTA